MSNNTFHLKRFLMLAKQHYIHNNKLFLYATVAYVGIIFLLLTIVQMSNDRIPHDVDMFRGFYALFIAVFGILFTGYSFPAFRGKESTINYLMVPGSVTEKFMFELLFRLSIILLALPFLFWITFHIQGFFFNFFTAEEFESIGFRTVLDFQVPSDLKEYASWFVTMIGSFIFLAFVLPFTGGAMFSKQPLVKTLFAVALIVIFFAGSLFFLLETIGIGDYQPSAAQWLMPNTEIGAVKFISGITLFTNIVLLYVAYRKLKEKEV